uniref:hypothetical protein n=1 Tax=Flavobacterium sp. TaxID=239 RepID=UPI0040496D21
MAFKNKPVVRYTRKQAKRGYKFAKKRYYNKSKKQLNVGKIIADVNMLKSIVNAEKKQIVVSASASAIGQVNGNGEGALTLDITPVPAQGSQDSQRNGDSIKICTGMFKFQISQMGACTSPISGVIELYYVLGTPQATSTFLQQKFLPNAFITGGQIRDYNAQPDQDYRPQYILISSRRFRVKGDNFGGQNQIININMPLKFGKYGHHVKYAENTNVVATGQIIMCVRCDNGNISGSTTSTLGNVISTAPSTGLFINRSMTYYYYDN